MNSATVEGILQLGDERQDGHLRDPSFPLRPAKGNFLVSKQIIRELMNTVKKSRYTMPLPWILSPSSNSNIIPPSRRPESSTFLPQSDSANAA
jgi:hypothetical protein